jgi:glycosyltransferase involved in cell wall biosynthesis
MRLLILMAHTSPWSLEVADSLKDQGHEAHVLSFSIPVEGGVRAVQSDVDVAMRRYDTVNLLSQAGSAHWRHLAMVVELRRLTRRLQPDLLLCLYGGGFALSAYLSGFRPYVVYVVGSDVLLARGVRRRINRVTLSRAALVLANGDYLARLTRAQAPDAKVETLLLGVDVGRFKRGPRRQVPRIFSHRAFSRNYNNETILRALSVLPDDTPEFEMIFASGGPDLDSAIALADKMLSPRIRAQVSFWRGEAPRQGILEALTQTDLYVSMSRSDGTPTSVLEAMSCGAFPILSDIPANRPLVDESAGLGCLVATEDFLGLAICLERCLRQIDACRAHAPSIRAVVCAIADARHSRLRLNERLESARALRASA